MLEPGALLDYGDVCKLLSLKEGAVRSLVKNGFLAAPQRYPGNHLRFRAEDLWDYFARRYPNPPREPRPAAFSPPPPHLPAGQKTPDSAKPSKSG